MSSAIKDKLAADHVRGAQWHDIAVAGCVSTSQGKTGFGRSTPSGLLMAATNSRLALGSMQDYGGWLKETWCTMPWSARHPRSVEFPMTWTTESDEKSSDLNDFSDHVGRPICTGPRCDDDLAGKTLVNSLQHYPIGNKSWLFQ